MPNLKGVKPGDVLLHTSENQRWDGSSTILPEEVVVHRVDTKFVYVPYIPGHPIIGTDHYWIKNGVGAHGKLWKPEDWKMEEERPHLEETLRRKFGTGTWQKGEESIPALRRLLAIMEGTEE